MTEATRKAAETNHQRHLERREEWQEQLLDRKAGIALCRQLRDDPAIGALARLEAVKLLMQIQGK